MTHETNVRAYKNIPFDYRLKKDGYYDITGSLSGGWNAFNLEFQPYNGVDISYYQGTGSLMTVTSDEGLLPDLSYLASVTGCLAEAGAGTGTYINYTKVGTPSVDVATGIVSNMSTANYLLPTDCVTPDNKPWEIGIKFTTGTSLSNTKMMFATTDEASLYAFYENAGNLRAWVSSNGTSWNVINGTTIMSLATSTTYKMKAEFTGTEYNWYLWENDAWTLKLSVASTSSAIAGKVLKIGSGFDSGATIDLSETYMKVDGQMYWSPLSGTDYVEKTSGDYYTVIGSPTIDSDKTVSDFSSTNYIKLPEKTPSAIASLDIIFKGNLTDVSSSCAIFAHASSSERYIGVQGSNSVFGMWTGSWVAGTTTLSTNTNYWFRVVQDGSNYKGYLLVDNNYTLDTLPALSDWSQEFSTTTNIFANSDFNIGYNYATTGEYFKGSIDLKGCSVNINGVEFWNPLVKKTAVRGLLPTGVTDDGSAQTWNLFYNGDYLLNTTSTMTGYTWVGSVAIPAHTV